ncbi:MAG: hypothetical protein IT367_17205, partial [Candidatus Hydrogenedentes bacterium]|nr:hypothetical protein [Candidatus Hydrogenedentota bacterium]
SATATSATSVNLTWNDNSSNETSVKIERKEGTSGAWSLIHSTSANATSYTDTTVTGDTTYYYRIRASDGTVYSQYSDETSVTTPSGLERSISGASTTNEGSSYTLNLSATGQAASSITSWTITWGDGTSPQTVQGTPESVTHTYTDGNANRTITATATDGDDTFEAGTLSVTVNNVAPTLDVQGDDEIIEGQVYTLSLDSTDVGDDTIASWTIDWGDGTQAYVYNQSAGTIEHTFAAGPSECIIVVTASDEDGTYTASATNVDVLLAAPSNVSAVAADNRVIVNWRDNSWRESGYQVARSTNGTTWTVLGTTLPSEVRFIDVTASQTATYTYKLTALDANGLPDPSASATLGNFVSPTLAVPTGLRAETLDQTKIRLTWDDVSGLEAGYDVQFWREGKVGLADTDPDETDWQWSFATDEEWNFRVRTKLGSMHSEWSEIKTWGTAPAKPEKLWTTISPHGNDMTVIWFDASQTEEGLRLERSNDNGLSYTNIANLQADETAFIDSNVPHVESTPPDEFWYFYRLTAYNGYADSESIWIPAHTMSDVDSIAAPSGFKAKLLTESNKRNRALLEWDGQARRAAQFEISNDGDNFQTFGGFYYGGETYALAPGMTHYFRMWWTDTDNYKRSNYTTHASVTTGALESPSGLEAVEDGGSIHVAWNYSGDWASGFVLEQKIDDGEFLPVAYKNNRNDRTFQVNDLVPGATYSFRVRAFHYAYGGVRDHTSAQHEDYRHIPRSPEIGVGYSSYSNTATEEAPGPTITIAASDPSGTEGVDNAQLALTRDGATSEPLTVTVKYRGEDPVKAEAGADYVASQSAFFDIGQSTTFINVRVIDDVFIEGTETAKATIVRGPDYTVGTPDSATFSISDNDGDFDHPPTVAADDPKSEAIEGQRATMTGSYNDEDAGDSVTLTASFGEISPGGAQSGTWSWYYDTKDGPDENRTVTVTATDSRGASSTTTFQLEVTNVAPAVTVQSTTPAIVAGMSYVKVGGTFTGSGSFTDPGITDTWKGEVEWGDGPGYVGLPLNDKSFTLNHTYKKPGQYTITVKITDDDLGVGTATLQVTVWQAEVTEVGFKNDLLLKEWFVAGKPAIDPNDGTAPTWTKAGLDKPAAYVKGTGATLFGKIAAASGAADFTVNIRIKDKSSGEVIATKNNVALSDGDTIVRDLAQTAGIVNVVKAANPTLTWELAPAGTDAWTSVGDTGPHDLYYTHATPKLDAGKPLYDLALWKACIYVNGGADVAGLIRDGI